MNAITTLLRKDLLVEYRSRDTFVTTLFFGLLVLVVGNFALSTAVENLPLFAPGVFWIAFFFSGLLFLNHILAAEKEENTIAGLLLSPLTPGHIFLGKMLSATTFLVALELILLPVFYLLFNYSPDANTIWLALVILLVAGGYSSLGVLFSTMALGLKNREVLLSVILFPILLPLLIMAVKSSIILLNHLPLEQFYLWLKMILTFDTIFVILSYWSYFWILEA